MPEKIGDYYIDFTVNDGKGKQQLNQLDEQMSKTAKKQEGMFDVLKSGWAMAAAGAAAAIAAVKHLYSVIDDLVRKSAKSMQASDAMYAQFGVRAEDAIAKLRAASGGVVDDASLIQSANRGMALNVTKDLDKMATLMQYARLRARAMGTDTKDAFGDIMTGIGRASPLILDNLGIITKGWNEEAEKTGKAYNAQFILNKVLEQAQEELKKSGVESLTFAEQLQKTDAAMENLNDTVGRVGAAFLQMDDADDKFRDGLTGLEKWISENKNKLAAFFKLLKDLVINVLSPKLIVDMFKFLTKGIIELGKNIGYLIANAFKIIMANIKVVWLQGVDELFSALKERAPKLFDFLGGGSQWEKNLAALDQAKEALKNLKLIALSPAASWEMIKPDQIKIFEEFIENWNKIDEIAEGAHLSKEGVKAAEKFYGLANAASESEKKLAQMRLTVEDITKAFSAIAKTITEDIGGAFAGVADSVVELGAAVATGNWLGAITAAVGLLKKAVNYTKEVKKEMREAFAAQYESWQGRATRARDLGYDAITGETYTNEDYLIALKRQAEWAKNGVIEGTVAVEDYYDILLEIRSVEEDITAEKKEQLEAIEDARDEAKQAYLDEISRRAGLGAIDTENWAQASKIIASMNSAGLSQSELVDALNSLGYKTSNLGIAASGAAGKTVEISGDIITNVYQATVDSALQQMAAAVKNAISE